MERTNIVAARIQFLRNIKKYRENGRPIIYTDETFVHSTHTVSKSWQSSKVSLQAPFCRGKRLIDLHAGSKGGFLKGTELVWKAKSSTGDYHDEMNGDNFFKWVKEKLIPHLPPKSVLIIDNAPYYNLQVDKCPTQASRKADIQAWLTRQQIPFGATLLKAELLQICKQHKPTPSFLLDKILKQYGHDCLRLTAYHAELNSIELIWATMKGYITRRNISFKMTDVIQLTHDAIEAVTEDDWAFSCRHVEEVERKYWDADIAVEAVMEKIVIQVTSSDEDTDTATECSDYSDTESADEECLC